MVGDGRGREEERAGREQDADHDQRDRDRDSGRQVGSGAIEWTVDLAGEAAFSSRIRPSSPRRRSTPPRSDRQRVGRRMAGGERLDSR